MASEQAVITRLEGLESWKNSNRLPTSDGSGERNLAKTILDMEIYVSTLINDLPTKESTVHEIIDDRIKTNIEAIIDSKLRTALQFAKGGQREESNSWFKSVLESKAVQEIGTVIDAKQYRQWNKKMKNALDQIRPNSRAALDCVEKLSEDEINEANKQGTFDSRRDVIVTVIANKGGGIKTCLNYYAPSTQTCGRSSAPKPKARRRRNWNHVHRGRDSGRT